MTSPKKPSISDRLGNEARLLPAKSHGWFRNWFRKVWNVRGGGLYACGFAAFFIYYEAGSIIEDAKQIGLLFDGHVVEFFVNFIVDSFKNTISAFIWPATVVQFASPWGAIALAGAYVAFPKYLKPTIERWLFDDDAPVKDD